MPMKYLMGNPCCNDTPIANPSRMSGVLRESPPSGSVAFPGVSRIVRDSQGRCTSRPTWRSAEAKSDRQGDTCKMSSDRDVRCLWSLSTSSSSSSSYSTTLPPLLSTATPRFRHKSLLLCPIHREHGRSCHFLTVLHELRLEMIILSAEL
jgi:hypothetical protein